MDLSHRAPNRPDPKKEMGTLVPSGDMPPPLGRLEYLYVGSADVEADLAFYRDVLGARVVWDFSDFGTRVAAAGSKATEDQDARAVRVAAVELGERPPLHVLAGHRPPRSVLPIFLVPDLDAMERALRERGWKEEGHRVEVPDGPVRVLGDPTGNEVGLLESVRPRALER